MSNRYFNFPTSLVRFVRNTLARAEDINARFDEVSAGLDIVQTEMDLKPPSLSPTFTGTPLAPNAASVATDTTQIATTAWVQDVIGATSIGLPPQLTHDGKALLTDGTSAAWEPIVVGDVQPFSSSGTWTKPVGVTFVMVLLWGAGGGGGSGRRGTNITIRNGGGGGGGGGCIQRIYQASDLTATVAVSLGAGRNGGSAIAVDDTDGSPGLAGNNSTFGAYCTAYGGAAGPGGAALDVTGAGGGGVGGLPFDASKAVFTIAPGETAFGGSDATGKTYSGHYGGGAGGAATTVASGASSGGYSSTFGGCGGGAGSGINGGARYASLAGGGPSHTPTSANGAAGTATISGAGAAGTTTQGGGGGGAGLISGAGVPAGAGGAGGPIGGGGGGGGASFNGNNSGAGGAGGNGYCVVLSW